MFVSIKAVPQELLSKEALGGKGYGLAWMASVGVNVPPAFVLPTSVCVEYMQNPSGVMAQIAKLIPAIKEEFKKSFGYMPLLSVRSGARVSMPGMMDTILNVGIGQKDGVPYLSQECYEDCVVRLVSMYGSVVKGLDRKNLESLSYIKAVSEYQRLTGENFPDADGQLLNSIEAVFKSWNNDRAKFYRKMNNIPEEWGTAVVVQSMVFGNLNDKSGTGVLFTRNPDSGENVVTGEFLVNAQGEDVVAGIRTPMPLSKMSDWDSKVADQLMATVNQLEKSLHDMQDVEFTVQNGELFILQTRSAKRSPKAAVKVAYDMQAEGLIDLKTALSRISARDLDLAQQAVVAPSFTAKPKFVGIPACSGVVSGKPVYSAQAAIDCKEPCILITEETTPEDIAGMYAAIGVITMTGGATSHAAVVARGMNKPCVVGVGADIAKFEGKSIVSFDGSTGRIWLEAVPVIDGANNKSVKNWIDLAYSKLNAMPVGASGEATVVDLSGPLTEVAGPVEKVKKALELANKVYVDFEAANTSENLSFEAMFGLDRDSVIKSIVAMLGTELTVAEKKRVALVGAYGKGFASVGTASNLESLVMAEGEVAVSGKKFTPAMERVLAWKASENLSLLSFGSYSKSAKSALSPMSAFAELRANV